MQTQSLYDVVKEAIMEKTRGGEHMSQLPLQQGEWLSLEPACNLLPPEIAKNEKVLRMFKVRQRSITK